MFEETQGDKKSGSNRLWIGIFVVAAAVGLGVLLYVMSGGGAKQAAPATAAPAAANASADPVHDLKVLRATMDKDPTGTTAVWVLTIQNKSPVYNYSAIKYETSYIGADNKAVLTNQGTLPAGLAPGEQRNLQIRDALYPAGTAWYKFRIMEAKATAQ